MHTNLFPAILLAGPPNCGKSVLAFLLTQRLRELGISHYLLRAVPDGEGDWFLNGQADVVQTLRAINKVSYSSQFVEHMHTAIESRLLPLLVDIGGRPQGEQFGLIKACTHSILLYRSSEEQKIWHTWLDDAGLLPIAELRSSLVEEEVIQERQPFLSGIIGGLERDVDRRVQGMTFGTLLERVAGICSYDAISLEKEHHKHAPYALLNERELAKKLSVPVEGERAIWSPSHLKRIAEFVPSSESFAIYGRGPVWLAAALATWAFPAPHAIYDARYGWLHPPRVRFESQGANLQVKTVPFGQQQDRWLSIHLQNGTREPEEIVMNPIDTKGGVVISGKMPRWLFAALASALATHHEWVAVDDPRLNIAIVVHSNIASTRPGDVFPRLGT